MSSIFKFILIILLFAFLSAALLYGALNSSFAWEWAIKKMVHYKWQAIGLSVSKVNVKKPAFNFKQLTFSEMDMDVQLKEAKYPVSMDVIKVTRTDQKIIIQIDHLLMKMTAGEIESKFLTANLSQDKTTQKWMGDAETISFAPYECDKFNFTVQSQKKISEIRFDAACYEGKIEGGIVLDYVKMLTYTGHVNVDNVDLDALEKVNPDVFSKMNGRMTGGFILDGKESNIYNFESNVKIHSNGEIKAVLLEPLLNYIPQSTQRKDLEALIKEDGNVPLELARVTLKKLTADQMSSEINLGSKKLNLNTNLTVEINVEGGIKNLYQHLMDFLKKGVWNAKS
jgi:hypothetical protein